MCYDAQEPSLERMSHLIVTLCIGDAFLSIAPVGQRVDDVAHVPVLILELLQDLRRHRGLIENVYDRCVSKRSICALTDNQKLNISAVALFLPFPSFLQLTLRSQINLSLDISISTR